MDVKGEVLLQLFNKTKLRNRTKTLLEPNLSLFIDKFKKLGFSAPLIAAKTVQKALDHLEKWSSLCRFPVSPAKYKSSISTDPPSSFTYQLQLSLLATLTFNSAPKFIDLT